MKTEIKENALLVGTPTKEQLEKINKFTRRSLTPDEVYVFSVVLCDNEIDRDFERFSDKALEKMAPMFVGKTGIFDHSAKGSDQCARIFETMLEKTEKMTTDNRQYIALKALAYMPKTSSNKWLIEEIDAGIKKEVSVGCSIKKAVCSICGATAPNCKHRKGKTYSVHGKNITCHFILDEPTDAYEWSFVAVPAQRNAGVTKAFTKRKDGVTLDFKETLKALSLGEEITVSGDTAKSVAAMLKAAEGFLEEKQNEILESLNLDAKTREIISKAVSLLEPEEIIALSKQTKLNADEIKPQLNYTQTSAKQKEIGKFKI